METSLANSASPEIAPLAAIDHAIVTPLPVHRSLGGWSWGMVGRFLFFFSLGMLGALLSAMSRGRRLPWWAILLGACLPPLVFLSVRLLAPIRRKRLARRFTEQFASPWGAAVAQLQYNVGPTEARSTIEARWKTLLERPDRPRAVVDVPIADSLANVTLRGDLLEAEAINQSARGAIFGSVMFLWLASMNALNYKSGDWWTVLVYVFMALFFLTRVPKVRDTIPMMRDTGRDLVAGPGWLRDRKGRRWTIDDSVAIVSRTRKGRKRPGVFVRMIGAAGVRDIQFASTDNPDLVLFWERWMHPKPRLDLTA